MSGHVIVSKHALFRARQRYGRKLDKGQIAQEVRACIAEGRYGCKPPREFDARHCATQKIGQHRGVRFAWSECGERCYVIRSARSNGQGAPLGTKVVIVMTSLAASLARAA